MAEEDNENKCDISGHFSIVADDDVAATVESLTSY